MTPPTPSASSAPRDRLLAAARGAQAEGRPDEARTALRAALDQLQATGGTDPLAAEAAPRLAGLAVFEWDWQAALAPVYLKTRYATDPVIGRAPTVFTVHNLAYPGLFEPDWLPRLDLPWSLFTIERLEYWGRISFLKGG